MVTVWSVLMLASAVVALTLATGLTVAAWGGRRDGLRTWALALALQALACGLLGWRAQWPVLWVTVGGGMLASGALACVLAAIARQQEQPMPWGAVVPPPLLLGLVLLPWHTDLGLAAALVGTVLAGQCAWVLWNLLERRFPRPPPRSSRPGIPCRRPPPQGRRRWRRNAGRRRGARFWDQTVTLTLSILSKIWGNTSEMASGR